MCVLCMHACAYVRVYLSLLRRPHAEVLCPSLLTPNMPCHGKCKQGLWFLQLRTLTHMLRLCHVCACVPAARGQGRPELQLRSPAHASLLGSFYGCTGKGV